MLARSPRHSGTRSSCLALLGASSILLAATGESMWHAHAAALEGRWAGPGIGVAAASSAVAANAIASTGSAMTLPDFKPFAFVPLTLPGDPGDWTVVEGTGVFMNADGDLVATLEGDSNNKRLFVWWDEGHYNGSTTTGGWKGPIKNSSNAEIVMHGAGVAGINSSDEICGTRDNSGSVAFSFEFTDLEALKGTVSDLSSGSASDLNETFVVVGTSSGAPVAWSDAFLGTVNLPPLSESVGTAAHGVEPGGGLTPFIVGQSEDDFAVVQAVVWYSSSGWQVADLSELDAQDDAIGIATGVNDDGHIVGAVLDDTSLDVEASMIWLHDSGSWTGEIIDDSLTDFLPQAVNNDEYPEVVGSHYLWKATNLAAFHGATHDLLELTINLPEDLLALEAWDINDAGEICGVAHLDDETVPRLPFKIVPYDTDNNETPDFREIILNPSLDENDNWLLDHSESMRAGMYAVTSTPHNNKVQDVAKMTVVRMHSDYTDIGNILTSQSQACAAWQAALSYLGGHDNENHQGKEIVLMIRDKKPGATEYDAIPSPAGQTARLDGLRCFLRKYARDIDYIQFGNEIFGGPGEYYVDFGECEGPISELDAACFEEACTLIFEWMKKQATTALEASALAGRPLQIITPAVSYGMVNSGYGGDVNGSLEVNANRNAFAVQCAVDFGNRNQAAVDIHLHYRDPSQRSDAYDGIDSLLEGNSQSLPIWDVPFAITALEWSPVPQPSWLTNNGGQHGNALRNYFEEEPDPPLDMTWEEYVDSNWAVPLFGQGKTIDVLIDEDLVAFDGLLRHACYGEFQQGNIENLANWDVTAVRAQHVFSGGEPWMLETNYEKLTNVAKGLAASGAGYIPYENFDPHPNEPFNGNCGCE